MAGLLVAALVVAVLLAAEVVAALVASKSCLSELYTVPCPQTVASIVVKILRKDGPAASAFLCLASRASARGFCRKHNILLRSCVLELRSLYSLAQLCPRAPKHLFSSFVRRSFVVVVRPSPLVPTSSTTTASRACS